MNSFCKIYFFLFSWLGHISAATPLEKSELVASLDLGNNQRLEHVAVHRSLQEPEGEFDVVRRNELRLVNTSDSTFRVIFNPGGFLQKSSDSMQSQTGFHGLYDAKVGLDRAEVLALGTAGQNLVLSRFGAVDGLWRYLGSAEIQEANTLSRPCKEARLSDWGEVTFVREFSNDVETYAVDSEGVVRREGKVFVPEKGGFGDSGSAAEPYKEKYRMSRCWYNQPRDELGIPINHESLAEKKARDRARAKRRPPQSGTGVVDHER